MINKTIIKKNPYLFANDSSLFKSSICAASNGKHINNDLKIISEYFKINKLTLNMKKSKVIHFRPSTKNIGPIPIIIFNGVVIESVTSIKYLGITFDQHLNWNRHITQLLIRCQVRLE